MNNLTKMKISKPVNEVFEATKSRFGSFLVLVEQTGSVSSISRDASFLVK